MFPENISRNFDKVREIALSDLSIEEKMKLFDEFDKIEVLFKNNIKTVRNCFLPIEGFENYAVNQFGDIISNKGDFVRLLSKHHDGTGYLKVNLYRDGKMYLKRVHRLVADTFLQNSDHMPQVNHIDGNRENNCLDNLEFCTALQNVQHAFKTGLHSKRGRLSEDELDEIVDMLNAGMIYKEIADRFNISSIHVNEIATGRSHKELYKDIKIPETKIKVRIRCLENGKIYDSQADATMDLNIDQGNISKHLKGKRSHVGGYHFIRIEEKES